MVDVILIIVLLVIVGASAFYIVREKKKGVKCIGCPMSGECKNKGNCHTNVK